VLLNKALYAFLLSPHVLCVPPISYSLHSLFFNRWGVHIIKLLILYFFLKFCYTLLGPNFFARPGSRKTYLFFFFSPREDIIHPSKNTDEIRKLNFVLFGIGLTNFILLVTQSSTRQRETQSRTRQNEVKSVKYIRIQYLLDIISTVDTSGLWRVGEEWNDHCSSQLTNGSLAFSSSIVYSKKFKIEFIMWMMLCQTSTD